MCVHLGIHHHHQHGEQINHRVIRRRVLGPFVIVLPGTPPPPAQTTTCQLSVAQVTLHLLGFCIHGVIVCNFCLASFTQHNILILTAFSGELPPLHSTGPRCESLSPEFVGCPS